MGRHALALLALFVALGAAPRVAAQPSDDTKEAARTLLDQGDAQRASGQLQEALRSYEAADKLMGVPTTRIEVARTLLDLGRLLEARAVAERVLAIVATPNEPEPFTVARGQATAMLSTLEHDIPALTVTVRGPAPGRARVRIDGTDVALTDTLRVDPGRHTLAVEAPGFITNTLIVDVGRAERRALEVRLVPAGVSGDQGDGLASSPLFWTGAATTLVGLGVGVGFGVASIDLAGDVEAACPGFEGCSPDLREDADASLTMANVSNVAFGVAGAGAIVMVIAIVLDVTEDDALTAAPGGLALRF